MPDCAPPLFAHLPAHLARSCRADDGGYTFVANWGGMKGSNATGQFLNPYGITRDIYGNFFVSGRGGRCAAAAAPPREAAHPPPARLHATL